MRQYTKNYSNKVPIPSEILTVDCVLVMSDSVTYTCCSFIAPDIKPAISLAFQVPFALSKALLVPGVIPPFSNVFPNPLCAFIAES